MPTTPGGRWSPGDSDEWDLTTDLAAMQVSNETASASEIQTASNYRVMTNGQRLALPSAQLREGLTVWTSDTRTEWRYTGSVWTQVRPFTSRTKNANQAVPTSTWTLVTFQVDDGSNGITYSNGTFTVNTTGLYLLSGAISYANSNTTGQRTGGIYKNGSLSIQLPQNAPHTVGSNLVTISQGIFLNAGETIAVYAYHSAQTTVNVEATKTTLVISRGA